MDTDSNWEEWAAEDPYYAVLTNEKFTSDNLSAVAKDEFFITGDDQLSSVFSDLAHLTGAPIHPRNALDFGCGVGRLLIPLARRADHATGLDVAPGMLAEARANCELRHVSNVDLMQSDDSLSALQGRTFDLIVSYLVIQHIPVRRGKRILRRLLDHLEPGGCGAIEVKYEESRKISLLTHLPARFSLPDSLPWLSNGKSEPRMEMNAYSLGWLVKQLNIRGVDDVRVKLDSPGRSLNATVLFQLPK